MFYATHIPQPPLSEFVERFWFYEGLDVPHRRERVLESCVEVVEATVMN